MRSIGTTEGTGWSAVRGNTQQTRPQAQGIAEGWRANLHALYSQVQAAAVPLARAHLSAAALTDEDRILVVVRRHPGLTAREIAQRIRGFTPALTRPILAVMVADGPLVQINGMTATHYEINSHD